MSSPLLAQLRDAQIARLRTAGCVYAEDELDVLLASSADPTDLERLLRRRIAGEPLEHVVGWAAFCDLSVLVGPGVFVPRRRTEHLVRSARRRCGPDPLVLDLCCGTGAVGAALGFPRLHAVDLDPGEIRYARRNLPDANVYVGDLYTPLPTSLRGHVDVIVASPPYVPTAAIAFLAAEARDHEPKLSLDGGVDGLDVVRQIVSGAPAWLAPTGTVLIETSERQAVLVADLLCAAGLRPELERCEATDATVLVGTRPR